MSCSEDVLQKQPGRMYRDSWPSAAVYSCQPFTPRAGGHRQGLGVQGRLSPRDRDIDLQPQAARAD